MTTQIAETSLAAYRVIEPTLNQRQREVMLCVHRQFRGQTFTRQELADALGWAINRVTGRVLELIEKGYLEESGTKKSPAGFTAAALRVRE